MTSNAQRIAVCALAVLAGCGDGSRPLIGIATNLEFADAAALAVADAQAEWGELPGDTIIAVEVLTRAALAIQSASHLADTEGVVAVVGHSNSAASLAAAPVYNEHRIVQLSPQSSASAYSDAGPYSFRLVPPDDRQGAFIAEALRGMEGVERIVVLYVNDDYGRGLRSSLLRALGAGPQIVGEAPHLEAGNVRVQDIDLARRVVAETRPDAVVWLGRPLILEQYLRVLRPLLGDAPIVGGDAVAIAERYGTSPLWEGVWFVDFVDLNANEVLRDFAARFERQFGRSASAADALTYDATRMLFEALHQGATTGSEVRAWLESLGRGRPAYAGITGPIQFNEDGDVARSYVLRRLPAPRAGTEATP